MRAGAEDIQGKDRVCQTTLARGRSLYVGAAAGVCPGVCRADRRLLMGLRPLLWRVGGSSWTDKEGPCRWASASNIVPHLGAGNSLYFLKG